MPKGPGCRAEKVVKNGHIHNNKQRYLCRNCGRQLVKNPTQKRISPQTKELIDRLLFEKITLAGIARGCDVSPVWLQKYVNQKDEEVPLKIEMDSSKEKGD